MALPLLGTLFSAGNIGSTIGAIGGLLGSGMAADSARRSADATVRAAEIAAEAAKFKPYGVKTGFGRGFFDTEAQTAGYELDPRLAAARDFYYQQAEQAREGLQGFDPQDYAAEVLEEQLGLLTPTRRAEDIALRQQQLQRGRIGLGVSPEALGAGMMSGAINPEQYAQNLARERINAELAVAARGGGIDERARRLGEAGNLFQTGVGIEELGMKPLEMGAQYGGRAAAAGANVGDILGRGLSGAAQTRLAGDVGTAQAIQRASKTFGGMFANQPITPSYAMPELQALGSAYAPASMSFWQNYG